MIVLVLGASGFIGSHLVAAVEAAGHTVIRGVRNPGGAATARENGRAMHVDFSTDIEPAVWMTRLAGVDAVINAIGILQEQGGQSFEAVHVVGPQALFSACVAARVPRVIHISALGADEQARSPYHLSKRRADRFLSALPLNWTIVQPSVVFGPGGTSARMFLALCSLPVIPLPGRGDQRVQPVHIDDLVAAIVRLLEAGQVSSRCVAVVGPAPITLRDFLRALRGSLGLGRPWFMNVPLGLVRLAARLGRLSPVRLLNAGTLDMLLRGNTGDPSATERLLGRLPRSVEQFVSSQYASAMRTSAEIQWLLPVLRYSIALVWIVTGVLSLGVYPKEASYALLAQLGATGALASVLLHGAALLNIALGIATLMLGRRSTLWLVQIALILVYTLLITWKLPQFWLHPYGPVLKNIPLLAAIWLMYELERHRWNT